MGQQDRGLMSTQQASLHGSVQLISWDRHKGPRRHSPALSCLVSGFASNHVFTKPGIHVACSLILGMDRRLGGSLHDLPALSYFSRRATHSAPPLHIWPSPQSLV